MAIRSHGPISVDTSQKFALYREVERIVRIVIEWIFAGVALFSVLFLVSAVGAMVSGRAVEIRMAGYHYKGHFFACWPLLTIGLMAVGGVGFYLVASFRQGLDSVRWSGKRQGISSEEVQAQESRAPSDQG
ncbi:hypothetical protein [Roseibacillus persicicus]|uniref:hypothetical protein n=1 Tax=Roseibacillus persicicus TaxID=454148 RepID=UPI002810251E|nr:hypothetical protein [Roseibacillus persicicus]MDQ8192486.1 hypothetical protein [Roseibacillus persicicus]